MSKNGSSSSGGGKTNALNINAKGQTERGACTYCGNMQHTRETCFKLHGYPEWWNELKARKQRDVAGGSGQAALVNTEPQLSLASQVEPKYESTTLNDQVCMFFSSLVSTSSLQEEMLDEEQNWWDCHRVDEVSDNLVQVAFEQQQRQSSCESTNERNEVVIGEESKRDTMLKGLNMNLKIHLKE
ncbi:hypothetical protein LWI28_007568 [Acer negundo]|uniref:Uncharacterized protein n=1 Tax=Acer negundo TaxID=4023 RepID=A0AAD5NF60_ACENE|nr:hypothetical protein LWI28_007568 [Acer negundo]